MTRFYETESDELTFVPFDIETTGFKSAQGDYVTTFILYNDQNYHIWLNTDGNKTSASEIQDDVIEGSGFDKVVLYVCKSESELLENVGDYLDTHTDDNTVLTAFNGETYKGDTDFDVPFLRTRCFRCGTEWILDGYWYSDIFEVFTQSSRFDTTIKAEPSLDSMSKSDLQQFIDDVGYDVHYDKMLKNEIVREINNDDGITTKTIQKWAEKQDIELDIEDMERLPNSKLTKNKLQELIDDMSLDIPYQNLSKKEIIKEIRERGYEKEMLIEWHNQTGRSIGTTEATRLDSIHESIIEDKKENEEWIRKLPFDLEVFSPFDPYTDSGQAVTEYMNGNYAGVILHCLADVARTVNLNRIMVEYAPKSDYKPKVL